MKSQSSNGKKDISSRANGSLRTDLSQSEAHFRAARLGQRPRPRLARNRKADYMSRDRHDRAALRPVTKGSPTSIGPR